MYSDTSTLPFRIDGDDVSTQLLDAPAAAPAAAPVAPARRSTGAKGPLVVLLVVGSLLLATLLVAIVIIAARGVAQPEVAGQPAPVVEGPAIDIDDVAPPTADAPVDTPPEPATPTGPVIDTFTSSNQTVLCNTQSPTPSTQYISFSWSVSDATRVYFGVDTADASAAPLFDNLPLTGTSTLDFPAGYNDYSYNCPNASRTYTLTAVDADGHKTSRSVVIVNEGDTV